MDNKIFFIFTGGSGNRGCEAIVRGSIEICKNYKNNISVFSAHLKEDEAVCLDKSVAMFPVAKTHSALASKINYLICGLSYKLGKGKTQVRIIYDNIWKRIKHNDTYFIIGGDVYCYGIPYIYYNINQILKNNNHILWGCSIEPDSIDDRMKKDLASYSLIIARESITYDALCANGLTDISRLYPDPAFAMKRIDQDLPNGFEANNTIGINISPMIMASSNNKNIVYDNYVELVEYILSETNFKIALIPHVIWENNDDRKAQKLLFDKYASSNRLVIVPADSAEVMKGYIARCRMMVAARTHASIAAYSECVPTLVVGYSVKSRGIAKDIFGNIDNYVISAQSMTEKTQLQNRFKWLIANENDVRKHLESFIPAYKKRLESLEREVSLFLEG